MTTRGRTHELETESQRAFESALPAGLVVRPVSDDYGIDREVEVFDAGATTGLTFKVQLKGTDKSGKTRRIKRSHLDYWHSLDVPVLLVSYEAPTGVLRARWVHSIGADGPDTGANTVTVHMDPEIVIEGDWPASLVSDLGVLRSLKRGHVPVPTPIRVVVLDEAKTTISGAQIVAAVLNLSRRTSSHMRAAIDETEAAITITYERTRVQAALPLRLATCSLRVPEGSLEDVDTRALAELALMLAASATAPVNEGITRAWLSAVPTDAPTWATPEFAERLPIILDAPECVPLLLDVHAHLVTTVPPVADLYSWPLLDLARVATKEQFQAYAERIRAEITRNSNDGGRLAFNLAQLHKKRREYSEATELLQEAGTRTPAYLNDPLYLRHLGGCLWELERFQESVSVYREALALGFDPYELLPLLADSLMYAGQYTEAQSVLKDWSPIGFSASDRLGRLRKLLLELLTDLVQVESQDRKDYDAAAMSKRYEKARHKDRLDIDTLLGLLRDADALHPLPWMHLAEMQGEDGDCRPAIACAILLFNNATAWVSALLHTLMFMPDDEPLIQSIIEQARFHCREGFYDAVWAAAADQDPEEAQFLRDLISAAYTAEPSALTNHIRLLDFENAGAVLATITFPAHAIRGYTGDKSSPS